MRMEPLADNKEQVTEAKKEKRKKKEKKDGNGLVAKALAPSFGSHMK